MRINGIQGVNQAYKPNKAQKAYGSSSVAAGKDTLALSDFAKELSVAKAAVSKTPDVRQAKVDEIKQQMEAGTYNITAAQVADKIIAQL
ncbi:flagellar biosynthesis anti-sigma factor FlgM [Petrocella sp. FN5]|uniref:flagellar biosynthesis anti-sigma factor FlgM n=1 Tax=Petrocella sp. FN5 TaxID=3032002 RepID=UPI0023DC9E81|nr:flagellar biosynthesis anti-sigma factor FlgM [Petrocella sp. FN5]MDF1618070.1 flagellar biosynthesis anti-sigma factor FlgM [Petrocella sp. FN5]